MKRILTACLLVIFATSLTAFLLVVISSVFDKFATIRFAFLIAAIAAIISAIIVAVWVVPIHLIFIKYHVVGLGWYILMSLVPSLTFPVLYSKWVEVGFSIIMFASCLAAGILSAVVFWYFAVSGQSK